MKKLLVPFVLAVSLLLGASEARAAPPIDPFFGRDKALHFSLSAAIAAGSYGGVSLLGLHGQTNRLVTAGTITLGIGYTKEVADAMGFGTPSWKDLVWDIFGTAVGLGVAVAVDAAFAPMSAHAR